MARLYNFMERFFDGMRNLYERTLRRVLRLPPHYYLAVTFVMTVADCLALCQDADGPAPF